MTCCSIMLLTTLRTWVFYNKTLTPSQTRSQLITLPSISLKPSTWSFPDVTSIASALRCYGTPLEHVREHTVNGKGKITSLPEQQLLEEVTQFKYLGATVTDDLSWSKPVSSVVIKARRILGMTYHKFNCFFGSSTLLRLYKAYVKSHLHFVGSIIGQRPRDTGICSNVCPKALLQETGLLRISN